MTDPAPIYLDHHATTPCDPRVVEAMLPALTAAFGNAASRQHAFGAAAAALVEEARARVAALIGASSEEIVFTSGATESDNLAVKGAALHAAARGRHVVTSAIEHRAVLDSCAALERLGLRVTYVRPDADGIVPAAAIEAALADDTALVSLMLANNEIGTVQPVAEVGAMCKERGILFHTDAVQAIGWLPCSVDALGVDLLSISAHKIHGPKGAGALYVRRRRPHARLEPIIHGGGHERGLRSGTLNVPGIVGLGAACALVERERESDAARVGPLRDRLLELLRRGIPDLRVNGSLARRLPCNLNASFPGIDADRLLCGLRTVAVSSGAACSSASRGGSYVLALLPEGRDLAGASLRFGLGRTTTAAEIDRAAGEIIAAVKADRALGAAPSDACAAPG